jgi:hypothetical protein
LEEVKEKLKQSPTLQAKTVFEWLTEQYPDSFSAGQLRTLQRHIKAWRALEGPAKEIFFPQVHYPGKLAECDFTYMGNLGVTIAGQLFKHLFFHFVLTYSNWETGSLCYSESWESFSDGLQAALWKLGGVPDGVQTDRLSAALHPKVNPEKFTAAYRGLLAYYRLQAFAIQGGKANENGDIEQRHHRFKEAVDQALLLRGGRDFESIRQYLDFIEAVFTKLNASRQSRLEEERAVLHPLPAAKLEVCKRFAVRVGKSSTIRLQNNTYSVHSRLRGELVQARLYIDHIQIWYAQRCVEKLPRLPGRCKHRVNYRHVIDWLVRKPGAFDNYRYQPDMFPTSYFRAAYDALKAASPSRAAKEYLAILKLAADESEDLVNNALRGLLAQELPISLQAIRDLAAQPAPGATDVEILPICLEQYDCLIHTETSYDQQSQGGFVAGA